MSKHKSEDYKLSAVKYYLNNQVSLDHICKINFSCFLVCLFYFFLTHFISLTGGGTIAPGTIN